MSNDTEKNFGVPEVDNTPMGQIGMMGRFYRGMDERQIKSPVVRIVGTLFALLFLIVPQVLQVYILLTEDGKFTETSIWELFGYGLFGFILFAVGIKIIYNLNFRKRSK